MHVELAHLLVVLTAVVVAVVRELDEMADDDADDDDEGVVMDKPGGSVNDGSEMGSDIPVAADDGRLVPSAEELKNERVCEPICVLVVTVGEGVDEGGERDAEILVTVECEEESVDEDKVAD